MPSHTHPNLVFGTANFGWYNIHETSEVQALLDVLKRNNVTHLDTAPRYPPPAPGRSEELLGQVDAAAQGFTIDTKILVSADAGGSCSADAVDKSFKTSENRLHVSKVNALYIHWFDPKTPIEEQAAAFDKLYKAGKFTSFGVSNVPVDSLKEFLSICSSKGYVKPTIYQGEYSAISRGMEKSLLPTLREHGMSFTAFRSISAGFLSGKLTSGNTEGTRFDGDGPVVQAITKIWSGDELKSAYEDLKSACDKEGITTIDAALRWISYHSVLNENDNILLGASSPEQLQMNFDSINKGPLSNELVNVFESVWVKLEPSRGHIL